MHLVTYPSTAPEIRELQTHVLHVVGVLCNPQPLDVVTFVRLHASVPPPLLVVAVVAHFITLVVHHRAGQGLDPFLDLDQKFVAI